MQDSSKSFLIKDLLRDLIHTAETDTGTNQNYVQKLVSIERKNYHPYIVYLLKSSIDSFKIHIWMFNVSYCILQILSISLCERVVCNFRAQ